MVPHPPQACPCRRLLLPGLFALSMASAPALAEPTPRPPRPDPLDPQANVPVLTYKSSLKRDLRPAADGPISWRQANDTVTRIGGWRAYAREANAPAPDAATAPTAATPAPTPATPHAHGGGHERSSRPQP